MQGSAHSGKDSGFYSKRTGKPWRVINGGVMKLESQLRRMDWREHQSSIRGPMKGPWLFVGLSGGS